VHNTLIDYCKIMKEEEGKRKKITKYQTKENGREEE
jgi:hypothetical protein